MKAIKYVLEEGYMSFCRFYSLGFGYESHLECLSAYVWKGHLSTVQPGKGDIKHWIEQNEKIA